MIGFAPGCTPSMLPGMGGIRGLRHRNHRQVPISAHRYLEHAPILVHRNWYKFYLQERRSDLLQPPQQHRLARLALGMHKNKR